MPCPMCCSEEKIRLGVMGQVVYYRCRDCGADYSSPIKQKSRKYEETMDRELDYQKHRKSEADWA